MRILAIGDIHGYLGPLDALLDMVAPAPEDRIITLGDYVDRGPDSQGVLERLLALHRTGQLVALRGNHDQMMTAARRHPTEMRWWFLFGGWATLESYRQGEEEPTLDDVPQEHWHFLDNLCVDWHEIDSHFFVHATVDPDLPLSEQSENSLLWERLVNPRPHISGKVMICGHTAQKSGQPLNLGHAICIDTYVYGSGWLTCLDVRSGRLWQANQHGERRQGHLDELAQLPEERQPQTE